MTNIARTGWAIVTALVILTAGCQSPYYADRGALFGGLTGAGLGALVGDSVGDAGAGAAIGAGVGAITGATVGGSLDEIDAKNRAQIAAQLGRAPQAGSVTREEVIAMSQAGVEPRLIVTHIRNNGLATPVTAADVIYLHEQGVATDVIEAMQAPPPVRTATAPVVPQPAPVIIEEHHYGPPWFGYYYHHGPHRPYYRPRARWGFTFSG